MSCLARARGRTAAYTSTANRWRRLETATGEAKPMLVIGTTEGVFVGEPGQRARATDLAGRGVNVLRRANGNVLAGTSDGVYRANTGGEAWQRVGVEDREVLEVHAAPSDERLIYAGTRPAALFRSRDGGDSWAEIESFNRA